MSNTALRPSLDRQALAARYRANRARSRRLFASLTPHAYAARPVDLRHPIVFYDGHLPAFSFNKLVREALGGPSIDPALEALFERGIDPDSAAAAQARTIASWPSRAEVAAFGDACDRAVLRALAEADLTDVARSPMLEGAEAAYAILEHEELHHETLLYLLHRLPLGEVTPPVPIDDVVAGAPRAPGRVRIPAGAATLGARRDAIAFGWDNEFDETTIAVAAFEIDVDDVTNGEYLRFVHAGGPVAPFWIARDGAFFLRTTFAEVPLPATWPVYVTNAQARAYARWRGGRLMSEAEFHRAAYGTPAGDERAHPWGDADPTPAHGNFGFRRYDPEPVGASPAGASAFGVHDLVGNGWEWTSTPFAPLPGFRPMASYPPYSADFFDDAHYVLKGASPVTATALIRRSFRNWYRADYPYVYAAFRCVYP